jgi:hypothetical protein
MDRNMKKVRLSAQLSAIQRQRVRAAAVPAAGHGRSVLAPVKPHRRADGTPTTIRSDARAVQNDRLQVQKGLYWLAQRTAVRVK